MADPAQPLKDLKPAKEYFVGVDSDGCVFDTMGIKHRECFCPWMIAYCNLQPVAEAARRCKDFADLFSKTRGANRHKTLVRILTELLPSHPMTEKRSFNVPQFKHYCQWVNSPDSLLSNEGLAAAIEAAKDAEAKDELKHMLAWSEKVNESVGLIVKNIPPFPYVKESLQKVVEKADMICCSATPNEALIREWQEHDIAKYPKVIAGQEMGKKGQHLDYATTGKYKENHVLMIGDAPGDMRAAKSVGALFYPVNPGDEAESWKRFHDEAFDKFINNEYAGEYEARLIEEYDSYLPENPPWMK